MPNNSEHLASKYIVELFAVCFHSQTNFEIIRQHLKFSFLQVEAEKKMWQYVTQRYDKTGRIPTVGQLQQHFTDNEKVLDLIANVTDIEADDSFVATTLSTFETYIKKMKFLEANDNIADVYNRGDKEKAWGLFVKYAEDFNSFSIQQAKFETVFNDFSRRQARRASEDWIAEVKIPTCIDELDYRLGGANGGPETGECVLWLGDSGSGKSQVLTHVGISGARQSFRTAHFQLEGTKKQCLNRYDAAWTGTLYQDVKLGNITDQKLDTIKRVTNKLKKNDIIVSSEEEFGGKSLVDIRNELQEMERIYGKIDLIIIDYLELLEVGDGHNYTPHEERFRQAKLAKGMKMLAMEFKAVVHTATQSASIPEEQKNDPDFVITRTNLSEDKGKIRPFDIFITINQTRDESREEVMRLHTDKLRDYRGGKPIKIANNFSRSRFYDRQRTLNMNDYED